MIRSCLEIPNFIQERNQTVQHGQPPPLSLTERSLTFNFILGKGSSGTKEMRFGLKISLILSLRPKYNESR